MQIKPLGKIWEPFYPHCHKAYVPTAYLKSPTIVRILVSCWNEKQEGTIYGVDVSAEDPTVVLKTSFPLMRPRNATRAFDKHGVTPSQVFPYRGSNYLFYIGWEKFPKGPEGVRYSIKAGVAKELSNGAYERIYKPDILKTVDPSSIRSAPVIVKEGQSYRLYYLHGEDKDWFIHPNGKSTPRYSLYSTTSALPFTGFSPPTPVLSPRAEDEFGFSRPCRLPDNSWLMGVRRIFKPYSIEHFAPDFSASTPLDFPCTPGLDDEMQAFPSIISTSSGTYMFYSGNGYGETGLLCAKVLCEG